MKSGWRASSRKGQERILDVALSSHLALRCALELGQAVDAREIKMSEVVNLRIEKSGEHLDDERILRARFRTGVKKLARLARPSHMRAGRRPKSTTRAWPDQNEEKNRIGERDKIGAAIRSLEQTQAIIDRHREIYEEAKPLVKNPRRAPQA